LPKIQESSRLEEIAFIRDEIANMVWRIETVVPMAHGWSREGNIAAHDLDAYLRAALPPPAPFHPQSSVSLQHHDHRAGERDSVRSRGRPKQ
jgi:hypothetical protein